MPMLTMTRTVRGGKILFALAGACFFLMFNTVIAADAGKTMVYDIYHEKYGHIGLHRVSFKREGRDLIVDVNNDIVVKFFFVTAFHFQAHRREKWRDGKMIAYDSLTFDDGNRLLVKARTNGNALYVDRPSGRTSAPVGIFPSHPWNKEILSQRLLLDSKTGELIHVQAHYAGKERIQAGGRWILANKYQITGDETHDVWFDEVGNWVRLQYRQNGQNVIFSLK